MRKRFNVAFLLGIGGAFVLILETGLTQISNESFFYMLEALPLYETFLSMLLLYSVYFLCAFISGYIFISFIDYLYLKTNKKSFTPLEVWGSKKKWTKLLTGFTDGTLIFISTSIFATVTIFIYARWWVLNTFPGAAFLLAVLFLCALGCGIFIGFIILRIFKMKKSYFRLAATFILITLSLLFLEILYPKIYFELSTPQNREDGPRVILITIDTLRADHLSSFRYRAITTSNIDKLALEGVTFKRAISPCPLTNPTHSSILTGLYPQTHGVRDTAVLDSRWQTLQRVFRRDGYLTAAFVSGFVLKKYLSGLDNDFNLYEDRFSLLFDGFKLMRIFERLGILPVNNLDRKAGYTNRLVIPWIRHYRNKKFFLWIHYYDPHLPYEPPARFIKQKSSFSQADPRRQWEIRGSKKANLSKELINVMSELYDGEVLYVDECIGEVMDVLEEVGLKDETLLILTSDHGEGFDHDYYFDHGDRLYDSGIHIPLFFRYPKGGLSSGREFYDQVQLIDIAPTVLSLVALSVETEMEGRDLSSFLYSSLKSTGFTAYSESPRRDNQAAKGPLRCARRNEWKYIYEMDRSKEELYNLKDDPLEKNNIINIENEIAMELKEALFKWMERSRGIESTKKPDMDELTKEKLRSLGYLQ